ncbi:MOSC domain-containing protein [Stackebrandtia soli]|uniref:MOSC domain-containing protein n=1 Tax=Stackebrandtia soli TaxID=1892856 RepID=UPI0039EB9AAD
MELLSVNIGHPRDNPWDDALSKTGIDKRAVSGRVAVAAPGPIGTGAVGLAGDRVFDVEFHGGDDQALYAYAKEDYDYWASRVEIPLHPGIFGENLTTGGLPVSNARIGDRWRIGCDVIVEVSTPRIPCGTFRGWMDIKGWLRTFTLAQRPGTYLRVISPGTIGAGDPVAIELRRDHEVTVALAFAALTTDRPLLPRLLAAREWLPQNVIEKAESYVADNPVSADVE